MRGKNQSERCRRIRHANRLRLQVSVQADQRDWLRGEIQHPVPPCRPLNEVLVAGEYADLPVEHSIGRYSPVRDQLVETYAKVDRLRRRRLARRAKRRRQEAYLNSYRD